MAKSIPPGRKRGRPKGTGHNDRATLTALADLLVREPGLPTSSALRRMGIEEEASLRRLRDKFHADREQLIAEAHERALRRMASTFSFFAETAGDKLIQSGMPQALAKFIEQIARSDELRLLAGLASALPQALQHWAVQASAPDPNDSASPDPNVLTPSPATPQDHAAETSPLSRREEITVPLSSISELPIAQLKPYPRNARTHSPKQIRQLARSITEFGFTNPVLIDETGMILAGHGRVEAAKQLDWSTVPCIRIEHMSPAQKRAYIIADNRLALKAGWDEALLAAELQGLLESEIDFDVSLTGFEVGEIDLLLEGQFPEEPGDPREDLIPESHPGDPVTRPGDLWSCGEHRLICADALDAGAYERLMGEERAQMVFTDPPYNVPIHGHVGGSGATKHREFAMASGEMSRIQFTAFLRTAFGNLAAHTLDGSVHFICMDWRHMGEMLEAADGVYSELKNLIVWAKDNGGMGTFYRSRHELIFAFKNGTAPHINSFELGQHGRYRTNVWQYKGVNTLKAGRMDELALHPTVKPVAMVADAIKDCSKRGGMVLDPFCGSGTILIATHKTGRRGRAIELDPLYCDTALRRWQDYAQDDAILAETGECKRTVHRSRRATSRFTRCRLT
jgi:DNA modification methylase